MAVAAIGKAAVEPVQTGYSRLRESIRSDIVEGVLEPGARLKIAGLAARYRTSAIPVREALQQLQGEGIVRFVANRGASVRPIDENLVRDIHEIRGLVEPFLVQWFVRHHTQRQLDALETIQRSYDAAAADGDRVTTRRCNEQFHSLCHDGHYNAEAVAIASRHTDLLRVLTDRFPKSRARVQAVAREHWAIVEAIRRQDEAEAMRLVAEHVRNSGEHLIEGMRAAARGTWSTDANEERR